MIWPSCALWFVIPGWSEGPDLRGAIAPRGISRFGVRCFVSLRSGRFRRSKTLIMSYYVYIIASRRDGAIYIGVTNNLVRRVYEHRIKAVPGFTSKYNITQLVWFEIYDDPVSAITREKELKKWKRSWKIKLIEAENPDWKDLYESICI